MHIYACSSNPGKLAEFALAARNFDRTRFQIEAFPNLAAIAAPEETGASFEENAKLKALYYSRYTPEFVLADDSGLEVAALNGAPGIRSARYAGPCATAEENNALLLRNLQDKANWSARFVCVLALAKEDTIVATATGSVEGEIVPPSGKGGFGYDPLFFFPPFGATFGETNEDRKFEISHRGRALRFLLEQLAGNR